MTTQEEEMVGHMLEFRKNMQSLLQHSFAGHVEFVHALKEGALRCRRPLPPLMLMLMLMTMLVLW